jgi:hypothetical protein
MRESLTIIYQQHRQGIPYTIPDTCNGWMWISLECYVEKKPSWLLHGILRNPPHRRGRQMGRVIATHYHEVVTSDLFSGKTQLNRAFSPLVLAAETVVSLSEEKRKRTLIRVDAGGGSDADINWLLARGYLFIGKAYSAIRAQKLCQSVTTGYVDPRVYGLKVGWIQTPHPYDAPTQQIGVRSRCKNGSFSHHLLVIHLSEEHFRQVCYLPPLWEKQPQPLLWFAYGCYDFRGGGIETEIKADKQGLGITKRNKQKFSAQQMLMGLADLAHNLVIWVNDALAKQRGWFAQVGIFRMVRALFTIAGQVVCDSSGTITHLVLNKDDPFADDFQQAIQPLLNGMNVNLGKF